jgi:hypothetical protein
MTKAELEVELRNLRYIWRTLAGELAKTTMIVLVCDRIQ